MEKINIYLSKYRACVLFKPKYMSNPTSFGLKKKKKAKFFAFRPMLTKIKLAVYKCD